MTKSNRNYVIENSNSPLRFEIPSQKLGFNIFGLPIVLYGLVIFIFPRFLNNFDFPMLFFLPLLLFFIFALAIEWLWLLIGVENIDINSEYIVLKHQIFGVGLSKKFLAEKIDGVFVSRRDNSGLFFSVTYRKIRFLDFTEGRIAINYGKTALGYVNTFRFGANLTEEETRRIVGLIHERFPQYIYKRSKNIS